MESETQRDLLFSMTSSSDRLHYYRLCYHELSVVQSQLPPREAPCLETQCLQAELQYLEQLIMLFVDINTLVDTQTITSKVEINTNGTNPMDSLDVSLVANIVLLTPSSPWILYVIDMSTNWHLYYVSPSVKRLLGWRPIDLMGKSIWEGCHQDDVQVLQNISNPKASSLSWWASSHSFGEYVTFRRLRQNQTIAVVHGTGIAISPRWYAWMEHTITDAKVALEGCTFSSILTSSTPSPTSIDGRRFYEGLQAKHMVEKLVVDDKVKENHKKNTRRYVPTKTELTTLLKSRERQNSTSLGESLPTHIDTTPTVSVANTVKLQSIIDTTLNIVRGKSVLLCDDSATYLKTGQALLSKMGSRVFVAHDGEEALQMLQHNFPRADLPDQFDIVFMDLSMPKMDGIQAVKLFRIWEGDQNPKLSHTLIIAVTANDTDGDMVLCAQTGFDGFVTKPLSKKKILDSVSASTP